MVTENVFVLEILMVHFVINVNQTAVDPLAQVDI